MTKKAQRNRAAAEMALEVLGDARRDISVEEVKVLALPYDHGLYRNESDLWWWAQGKQQHEQVRIRFEEVKLAAVRVLMGLLNIKEK